MQRYYKALIVAIVILLTLSLMWLDRTHVNPDESVEATDTASPSIVPDVSFTLLDGGALRLYSLKGHTVLLHFWASWCLPCRVEFPALMDYMARDDTNSILLAVSADASVKDARAFIAPYRKKYKKLFESGKVIIAQDPQHSLIERRFQSFQYPETIVIGPDLFMQKKLAGSILDWVK